MDKDLEEGQWELEKVTMQHHQYQDNAKIISHTFLKCHKCDCTTVWVDHISHYSHSTPVGEIRMQGENGSIGLNGKKCPIPGCLKLVNIDEVVVNKSHQPRNWRQCPIQPDGPRTENLPREIDYNVYIGDITGVEYK